MILRGCARAFHLGTVDRHYGALGSAATARRSAPRHSAPDHSLPRSLPHLRYSLALIAIVVERALSAFKDGVPPLLAEHAPPSQTSAKAARRASAQCLCASLAHVFSKKWLARYLVGEHRSARRVAAGDDPFTQY